MRPSPAAARGGEKERRYFLMTFALQARSGRGRAVPVPEGHRRKLAGGKSAPADAAPGTGAGWLCAPTGHRRKRPAATSAGGIAAGRTPPKTSSMPRWGKARSAAQPGAAPAARACPRLISSGVPPGRRARRRRQFPSGLMVAARRQNPRGTRGFWRVVVQRLHFPAFLCVHRVSVVKLPCPTATSSPSSAPPDTPPNPPAPAWSSSVAAPWA